MLDPHYFDQQLQQFYLLQNELKNKDFPFEDGDIKVILGGDMKVRDIILPVCDEAHINRLKALLNKALTNIQNDIMQELQRMESK